MDLAEVYHDGFDLIESLAVLGDPDWHLTSWDLTCLFHRLEFRSIDVDVFVFDAAMVEHHPDGLPKAVRREIFQLWERLAAFAHGSTRLGDLANTSLSSCILKSCL